MSRRKFHRMSEARRKKMLRAGGVKISAKDRHVVGNPISDLHCGAVIPGIGHGIIEHGVYHH